MSLLAKNKPAAPAAEKKAVNRSVFGGITKPKASFKKVYLEPGRYVLEVTGFREGVSNDPKKKGFPYVSAGLKVLEAEPMGQSNPTPVGETPVFTRYFAGPQAEFHQREWRDLACAILGVDDQAVDWENLEPADREEFEESCADMFVSPDKYVGAKVLCTAMNRTGKDGKSYTNLFFDPVSEE